MKARPPLRKRVRRAIRHFAIRGALGLCSLLPLGAALALGRALGTAAFALLPGQRRLADEHLSRAFPDLDAEARRRIARRSFALLGESVLELTQLARIDPGIEGYIDLKPSARAALDAGISRGHGVLALTGHIGSWELLMRRCLQAGYPVIAVGREAPDPRTTALVDRMRGEGKTIWRGAPSAGRQLLRAFRDNHIVAMLVDQDTRVQGVFVPFFGEPAFTPRAPADLALRTGATIVAIFIHRRPGGGHVIEGHELPVPEGSTPESVTAAMTSAIEGEIRAHPAEWVWMHRRWKTRPENQPELAASTPP